MSLGHCLLSMIRLMMIPNLLVLSLEQWLLAPVACPASCLPRVIWLLDIFGVCAQQVWHPLWGICGRYLGISQFLQINLGRPCLIRSSLELIGLRFFISCLTYSLSLHVLMGWPCFLSWTEQLRLTILNLLQEGNPRIAGPGVSAT